MKKIIFTFLLFIVVFNVKATELISEYQNDYYEINYNGNSIIIDSIYKSNDLMPVFKLSLDNYEISLDDNQKEYVNLIIYYNYYKSNQSFYNYVVTQSFIYKYLNPNLDINSFYHGEIINTDYDLIIDKINDHYKMPLFNNQTYSIDYGKYITFNDSKISEFNIKEFELAYEKTNDSLKIYANNYGQFSFVLEKKDSSLNKGINIYDNKYISLGYYEPIICEFYINVIPIKINIYLEHVDNNSSYNVFDADTEELIDTLFLYNGNAFFTKVVDNIKIIENSHDIKYKDNENIYYYSLDDSKEYSIYYNQEYQYYNLDITILKDKLNNNKTIVYVYDEFFNLKEKLDILDNQRISLIAGTYYIYLDKFTNEMIYLDNDLEIELDKPLINTLVFNDEIINIYDSSNNEILFTKENNLYYLETPLDYGTYYIKTNNNDLIYFVFDNNTDYFKDTHCGNVLIVKELINNEEDKIILDNSDKEILQISDVPDTFANEFVVYIKKEEIL